MAGKKKAAKKVAKEAAPAEAVAEEEVEPVAEESEGEEVVSEPAHVEEATIQVRGTGVGGVKMMTPSEHKAYCEGK